MSIYIISNDLNSKNNLYKLGRTKDTNVEIVTKYQRYLPSARLFLWYPSTDCVAVERELLEMFKSHRGQTPNGFRNEWLNISFSELKLKLDQFFGFDGEAFEEERKKTREIIQKIKEEKKLHYEKKIPTCEYCNNNLSNNQSLKRHYLSCNKKNKHILQQEYENQLQTLQHQLQTQQDQYENQLQTLQNQLQTQQEKYEHQLQTQQEKYEQLIQTQQERIEKLENRIFEIAKQSR